MDSTTPLINAFIKDIFKRIYTIHVMHRASIVSVILFIIYIIDYPDPYYFFLLALFIVTVIFTRTPRKYFKLTMKSMEVKPLQDPGQFKLIPGYWVSKYKNKPIADEIYKELEKSLTAIPNMAVTEQINKVLKLRGYINYYDLLNIIMMAIASDKYLYKGNVHRFEVRENYGSA